MTTIPQLRKEMAEFADQLCHLGLTDLADRIYAWENQLHRRAPVRRAPPTKYARPDFSEIREFAEAWPTMSYMEIAHNFDCSIGRVSEALAGFRE